MARTEIQLALRRLWLEVSTYAVRDEEGQPLGAVLVFEDLTAQKELAAQKRQAEQFQLLTRVVARIADEIKNPLVSINTFIELIGERYDDPDFRRHFSSVVRRDVRRLVEVFEKLAGLVTEGELNFTTVDAREVVGQLVDAIDLADEAAGKHLQLDVVPRGRPPDDQGRRPPAPQGALVPHPVPRRFNSPTERPRSRSRSAQHEDDEGGTDVRILVGSRTASVASEKLQRLFDPVQMVQESLIDVGPAVSQRLVEALGGRLRMRQTRHELAFLVTLPAAIVTTAAPPLDAAASSSSTTSWARASRCACCSSPPTRSRRPTAAGRRSTRSPATAPTSSSSTSRCRRWTGSRCCAGSSGSIPSIEVVMITAYASLETVKLALTHGAFEYLIKPFSRQDLEDVVRRALVRRQAELGARGQVARLVEEMRRLAAKTRELEEAARREAAEQSLRVTQLSILREISRTIVGQLEYQAITTAVTGQLHAALGYDVVAITPDGAGGRAR